MVVHGGQCVWCGQPEEAGEAVFQPVSDVPNLGCRRDASSRRQNPIPEKTDKWAFEAGLSRHSCGLDSSHSIPEGLPTAFVSEL